jgi:sec-independent protein translocase protein TatB
MFEVGFSEICMVGLVALLVIGPEKLPKFARMAGFWVAKSKRMLASVKQEISEEFQAEELRQSIKNQSGINEFQQLLDNTSKDIYEIKDSVSQKLEAGSLKQTNTDQDDRK